MTTQSDEIRPEDGGNSFPEYRRHLTSHEVIRIMGLDEEEKIYRKEYERVMRLKRNSPRPEDIFGDPTFQDDYWGRRKNEIKFKAMLKAFQDKHR